MTLSVKRIYGKLYVYDQWREGDRIVSKYIGPLEKIVESIRVVKSRDNFNYKGFDKVIERLRKEVGRGVVKQSQQFNYNDLNEVIDNVLNIDQREVVNFNYPMQDEVIDSLVRMFSRVVVNWWCGGWGLNPRRPTPPGPEPGPFDLARAPPHTWRRGRDLNPRAPRRGSGSLWLGG